MRVQTIRFRQTPAHAVVEKVDVYRTWGFRRRADQCTPLEMGGYLVSSAIPTLRHIAKFEPDLIHAHFAVPTGALAFATGLLSRLPYVITVQLGDVPGAIPEQTDRLFRWLNPMIRPIWRYAAGMVTVSKFVADLAVKAYRREPIIIPNGISLTGRPGFPQLFLETAASDFRRSPKSAKKSALPATGPGATPRTSMGTRHRRRRNRARRPCHRIRGS